MLAVFPGKLDPDHARSVKPATLQTYQKHLKKFVEFLHSERLRPQGMGELGALIVAYKQQHSISRSNFEGLLAALEFFLPQIKGSLLWSKRVGKGLAVQQQVHHTIPLTLGPAKLVAALLASRDLARLGIGLLVQVLTGLRPSELLQLERRHVMMDDEKFLFRLGAKTGTKLKREQCTWLRFDRDANVTTLLNRLLVSTPSYGKLCQVTYDTYRLALRTISRELKLSFCFTPHSPRAGFASEAVSRGEDAESIRIRGRWQSETSFRIYTDVIGAALIESLDGMKTWRRHMVTVHLHLISLFPGSLIDNEQRARPGSWNDDCGPGQLGRPASRGVKLQLKGPAQKR